LNNILDYGLLGRRSYMGNLPGVHLDNNISGDVSILDTYEYGGGSGHGS